MSFTSVINNIISTLSNDAALGAYCTAKWGKSLTVMQMFRHRQEIHLGDLPLIFITRPSVEKQWLSNQLNEQVHQVRLFCGFHQPDREKALAEMLEYEEKITDALFVDRKRGDTTGYVLDTDIPDILNDEGEFAPVYFTVISVPIITELT